MKYLGNKYKKKEKEKEVIVISDRQSIFLHSSFSYHSCIYGIHKFKKIIKSYMSKNRTVPSYAEKERNLKMISFGESDHFYKTRSYVMQCIVLIFLIKSATN